MLERQLDEAQYYFWFADNFGWDRDTVDRQPVAYLDSLITIGTVRDEVAQDKQRKAQREQGG